MGHTLAGDDENWAVVNPGENATWNSAFAVVDFDNGGITFSIDDQENLNNISESYLFL